MLDTKGSASPTIYRIDRYILESARRKLQVWGSEDKQSLVPDPSAINALATQGMRAASLLPTGSALGSSVQVENETTGRGIFINHTNTNLEVHAWTKKDGFYNRAECRILKLPKTVSKDTANVAIHLPKVSSEDLKVIVNVAAQRVYTLDGTMTSAAPTIVWRDLQTVLQSRAIQRHLIPPNKPATSVEKKRIVEGEVHCISEIEDGPDEELQDVDLSEQAALSLSSTAKLATEDNSDGSSEGARKRRRRS